MCGLAGYFNLSTTPTCVNQNVLDAMQESIKHRGPNGHMTWADAEHGIALVHRRLSIVDLSDAGAQPMFTPDTSVVIVFNGEIYNHRVLRAELEKLGYVYRSQTDTETLLYAYQAWGIDFIHRLEGMFAIALYDFTKRELYLIRDRIGIKPLYFSLQGGYLSFGSEIKALWQLPWVQRSLDRRALYHCLTFMVPPAPLTLYSGVYKLPAAHYAKVDAHKKVTFHEWYDPLVASQKWASADMENEEFCIEMTRTLLREAVKKRMMSDVPFGVFLSGGIDSSLNVALMSEFTDQVKTYNVSFSDGPEYSEVMWARKVAQHFGTEHHETVISEKEAYDFFERMVYHQDEPITDCVCVPLYYVSKLLKDSGTTVVQVGEGSDELFCGYSSYARYLDTYNSVWYRSQNLVPQFARRGAYAMAARLFPDKQYHLGRLKTWANNENLFWGGAIVFSEDSKRDVLAAGYELADDPVLKQIYPGMSQRCDSYAIVDYHLKKFYERDPQPDFLKSMIYLELKQRLPELLLMRVDKMTMATGVEGRVPFLDHAFVEFALQVPSRLKYKDGQTKYLLKKACEGILPHDVIYRKKVGFAAPTSRWFKQGAYFQSYFQELLKRREAQWGQALNMEQVGQLFAKNKSSTADYAVQLWVLQNIIACEVS